MGNRGGLCFAQALQVNVVLESLDLGDTDLVSILHRFSLIHMQFCSRLFVCSVTRC